MTTSLLVMELAIVSLLLGWVWVVIAASPWPAPWTVLLAGPFALIGGRMVPYTWRRINWFDALWWAIVAVVVAILAEFGNSFWPGASSGARWNVQFVAGLLVAWRAWALAEGWIDRELVESEMQIGTLVVLGILLMLIWIAPGAGLLPALVFVAAGLVGMGLARRAQRRDPRAGMESDWLVLVAGLVVLVVLVAIVTVLIVTPDLLLAIYEQALTALVALISAVGALFQWIGSFFTGAEPPQETQQVGPSPGQLPSTAPVNPEGAVAGPPFWVFELLLTFAGVVFLFFAIRAIIRLMKMNVSGLTLRLPRQREPAPPVSTADSFTWRGWWQQILIWFRGWLAGTASPAATGSRARQGAGAAVAEQRSIRALYREFLGMVARAGFERQPSTTPNELAREVNAARPAASPAISTVTELYVRARYGEEQVSRDELSRMRNAVQQARRQLTPPASSTDESAGRPTAR